MVEVHMNNDLNDRIIESAKMIINTIDKSFEVTQKIENDNSSRIVWIVAISGFALLNFQNIAVNNLHLPPAYIIPWIMTAILGIVTHWIYRNVTYCDFELYQAKKGLLLAFIVGGPENATLEKLKNIFSGEDILLKERQIKLLNVIKKANLIELLTMIMLVISIFFIFDWYLSFL
jgi:hypothetical protein